MTSTTDTWVEVTYTTTSDATVGPHTLTLTTDGGSANGQVSVTPLFQLTAVSWSYVADGSSVQEAIYKKNLNWRDDTLADEGTIQVSNPVWVSGGVADPVAYTAGTTPTLFNITLTATPQFTGDAMLNIYTDQDSLWFPTITVHFDQGRAVYPGPVASQAALPNNISNINATLDWSISIDGGQNYLFLDPSSQTIFVTLGLARGFSGEQGLAAKPTITATRLNYVTNLVNGSNNQDAVTQAVQVSVDTLFGAGGDTLGDLYNSDEWAALDAPNQHANLDCWSRTGIGIVQVLMTGIDASIDAAYPTTDSDATKQETRDSEAQVLGYLLDDGSTKNVFEAYLMLFQDGQAIEAYTFLPLYGPLPPWTADVQGAPPPANGQLAFEVMYNELKHERTGAQNSGQQWWISNDGLKTLVEGPISFPVIIQ